MRLTLASASLLTIVACHSSPTKGDALPGPVVALTPGIWTGPMTDDRAGAASLRLDIVSVETAERRSSWEATFAGSILDSGIAIVAQDGAQFRLLLSCAAGGSLLATVTVADSRMTGSYSSVGCSRIGRGSIDLGRQ